MDGYKVEQDPMRDRTPWVRINTHNYPHNPSGIHRAPYIHREPYIMAGKSTLTLLARGPHGILVEAGAHERAPLFCEQQHKVPQSPTAQPTTPRSVPTSQHPHHVPATERRESRRDIERAIDHYDTIPYHNVENHVRDQHYHDPYIKHTKPPKTMEHANIVSPPHPPPHLWVRPPCHYLNLKGYLT